MNTEGSQATKAESNKSTKANRKQMKRKFEKEAVLSDQVRLYKKRSIRYKWMLSCDFQSVETLGGQRPPKKKAKQKKKKETNKIAHLPMPSAHAVVPGYFSKFNCFYS
jgi:hypothetical protein